jgi:hypothetical protein
MRARRGAGGLKRLEGSTAYGQLDGVAAGDALVEFARDRRQRQRRRREGKGLEDQART